MVLVIMRRLLGQVVKAGEEGEAAIIVKAVEVLDCTERVILEAL